MGRLRGVTGQEGRDGHAQYLRRRGEWPRCAQRPLLIPRDHPPHEPAAGRPTIRPSLMDIRLVPHDPEWADTYQRAAVGIRDALGETALSIDHVGSTAIPGIDSKPVLDVLILVERYDPESAYRVPLESLGYVFG